MERERPRPASSAPPSSRRWEILRGAFLARSNPPPSARTNGAFFSSSLSFPCGFFALVGGIPGFQDAGFVCASCDARTAIFALGYDVRAILLLCDHFHPPPMREVAGARVA